MKTPQHTRISGLNRREALLALSTCSALLSACTRPSTLADEFEGKVDMTPEENTRYRKQKWYPKDDVRYPPFFGLEPALLETLVGTATGSGGVRLLHASRKRTLNFQEGPKLAIQLLDNAKVKPRDVNEGASRLLFREKLLFLISLEPAILLLVPDYTDFHRDSLFYRLNYRGFSIVTEEVSPPEFRQGSGIFLSSMFPGVSNIEVVSDNWAGVRTLAQMEMDAAIPFRTMPAESPDYKAMNISMPAENMPSVSFLRLALKDSHKKNP